MIYFALAIGLLVTALGFFKETSAICETLNLGILSGDQNNCYSGIWNAPDLLSLAGLTIIVCSFSLLWLRGLIVRSIWFIGLISLLLLYLNEGLIQCGDFLCGIVRIYALVFFCVGIVGLTTILAVTVFVIQLFNPKKIKPTTK